MKRTVFASIAILALLVSFAGPVRANGVARGRALNVALQGLPETCPVGASMTGDLTIQLVDRGVPHRSVVTIDVTAETPFGESEVFHATFRMMPGSTRRIPLDIPVGDRVPPGEYSFDVTVSVKGESLVVEHDVLVYAGK